MKNIGLLTVMLLFVSSIGFGVEGKEKTKAKVETVVIQTNAICGSCKDRIEKELNYTKGVVFAELDLDSKKVTVKFKTKLLVEKDLHDIINNIGYSTNLSNRNQEAFEKLPKCCQSEGHCTEDE